MPRTGLRSTDPPHHGMPPGQSSSPTRVQLVALQSCGPHSTALTGSEIKRGWPDQNTARSYHGVESFRLSRTAPLPWHASCGGRLFQPVSSHSRLASHPRNRRAKAEASRKDHALGCPHYTVHIMAHRCLEHTRYHPCYGICLPWLSSSSACFEPVTSQRLSPQQYRPSKYSVSGIRKGWG